MTRKEESLAPCTLPLPLLGNPSIRNRGSSHWIKDDLIAFGCGRDVIIIDSKTLKLVQICSCQSGDVTHVYWLPTGRAFTNETAVSHRDLISVDTNGEVVIWNAFKGEVMHRFSHPENSSRAVVDVHLAEGVDHWSRSKVYILYTGHLLVVFDHATCTYQNISIQIGSGPEFPLTPVGMFRFAVESRTSNPAMNRFVFLSRFDSTSSSSSNNSNDLLLTFCGGWDYQKETKISLRKQVLLQSGTGRPTSAGPGFLSHSNSMQNLSPPVHPQASSDTPEKGRPTSIRRLVSDIIVGADLSGSSNNHGTPMHGTLCFHPGIKDTVLVSSESNIHLVSVHFMVILHTFSMEKLMPPITQAIPTRHKSCIITIHENGSVYLRKYIIVGTHIFTMDLETVCFSDSPRFAGKRPEVISCGVHPFEENSVVIYFSDGRYLQYGFVGGEKGKISEPKNNLHANTPSTPFVKGVGEGGGGDADAESLSTPFSSLTLDHPDLSQKQPSITQKWVSPMNHMKSMLEAETDFTRFKLKRMTPSLGQPTTLKARGNTLILGTSYGYLVVVKVIKGCATILKKIACHSTCAVSGIEFISEESALTYANINFSSNLKCELMMTDLLTGSCLSLKTDAKHHIQCISVSPLKQYFVLVYQNGAAPCELWDLTRRQQIKTLPSKLPSITCVQWKETDPDSSTKDEVFFLTDYGTFLFTFRVEGNRFAAATCVKLDTNNTASITGIPISLFTRSSLVFRVDSNGTMVIYNTEKKTASPGFQIGKGPLLSVNAFGGSNFIAQFTDCVELWDFQNLKKVRTLMLGKMTIAGITIMRNWMVYYPTGSNSIKFIAINPSDESSSKHPTITGESYNHFMSPKDKCIQLYNLSKDTSSGLQALVDLCRKIGTNDEVRMWSLLKAKLSTNDFHNEGFQDVGIFSNDVSFKEMLVKISQCVWASDMNKREDVGRLLLLCGEMDKAAEVLLDTEPTIKGYVLNGMKASIAVASSNLPEQSKAVLKITATNLIACGDTDGGLELLCLLGKHSEACKYIESSNEWQKAILLCKTALPEKNSQETLNRYAQYLVSKKCVIQAALVYIYIGKYENAAEALFGARLRHLSYLLLVFCARENIELNLSDHIRLAINLDFARFLFDYGLTGEAINFCETLGNDAKDLKHELEILAS